MAESTPSQHVIETMIKYFDEVESIIEDLKSRLPEGMGNCKIVFKECEMGHGRLLASNWTDSGCRQCEIGVLRVHLAAARLSLKDAIDGLSGALERLEAN